MLSSTNDNPTCQRGSSGNSPNLSLVSGQECREPVPSIEYLVSVVPGPIWRFADFLKNTRQALHSQSV